MISLRATVAATTLTAALALVSFVAWNKLQSPVPERTFLFDVDEISEEEKKSEGHAWEMFDWWYGQRAYPNDLIPADGFGRAWEYRQEFLAPDAEGRGSSATWESIGPDNIGGRMLALAIDPTDTDILWAGSASGGLWKSTSAGVGAQAWFRVETGLPTLSVSSIVLDPADTDVIYIGTGEISRYERPLIGTPGARASYGMGIVKSTDGGASWNTTGLTWTFDQNRAVLALRMDPTDSQTLWAATSEGVYRTTNGGTSWTVSHNLVMAMDVAIDPTDPNVVYASHGQLGVPEAPDAGIYKTTNGGFTWSLLGGGLPTTDFGRTPLSISSDGGRIYAGVSDAASRQAIGLFRSTNDGTTWTQMSGENWAGGQAWYDNIIAVSPTDDDLVLCGGLDAYRTTNGGSNLSQVTYWWAGYDGVIPPGGSEGPDDYVHADHHAITFDPVNSSTVYISCDGGVFKSTNSGVDWFGVNGGLVTTQFYAGFANGFSTQDLALGGLQDNGTVKYEGTDSWNKVFGGDGGWCAIDPTDEDVLYEEYVRLNMHKSTDGGQNWFEIHEGNSGNFIAPFVLAESSPNILYAGTYGVEKSTNGGNSWFYPDGDSDWNGTYMATIGVSFTDEDYVVAGTGSSSSEATMEVRRTTNGGTSWTDVSVELPDRYPTDFAYDPNSEQIVWATFSGYGTGHVFRSADAGLTWDDVSGNLPDIPAGTVAVDPADSDVAYVGTDLGIYRTLNGGLTWSDFNQGMPIAMVLDLRIKSDDRLCRAATFGNGVWEVDLPDGTTGIDSNLSSIAGLELAASSPNPFQGATTIRFTLARTEDVHLAIYDQAGRRVRTLLSGDQSAGETQVAWDGRDQRGTPLAAGVYFARLAGAGRVVSEKLNLIR